MTGIHETTLEQFERALTRGFRHDGVPSHQARRAMLLAARAARRVGRPMRLRARTFWGDPMTVVLAEFSVARTVFLWGLWEPGLTRIMIERLRPGMTVIDVGAHFGYYSLLASRLVGPDGLVHAFEPAPATFAVLLENARGRRIEAFDKAVYSREAELVLQDYGPRYSAQNTIASQWKAPPRADARPRERTVDAISIDEHVARSGVAPSFVKVDAESAEWDILEGMEETLRRHRPMVTLEVGGTEVPGTKPPRALVEHMLARGYAAWESDGGPLRRHELRDRYEQVDNILFVPEGAS